MDGETSWEGQGFTLAIFVAVVVLCSVFFILGMLAGRSQVAVEAVPAPVEETVALPEAADDPRDPDLTFYEGVGELELPGLELPESETAEPLAQPPESTAPPASDGGTASQPAGSTAQAEVAVMLQVGALTGADQADALRMELMDLGFQAFVLRPGPDDTVPFYRVRVGPFTDDVEIERVRAALSAEGHDPILVQ